MASLSSQVSVLGFKYVKFCGLPMKRSSWLCEKHFSNLTNAQVRAKRNAMFDKELQRQKGLVTRIEKIEVELVDPSFGCSMVMNKDISTPNDCCKHINEMLVKRSALALVNGKYVDIYEPLKENCTVKLLHFLDSNVLQLNKAFWRSCSFLLGLILEKAFKEEYFVELHSWPKPDIFSGSFIYDAELNIKDWKPTPEELQAISIIMWKLAKEDLKFERLEVETKLAIKMFEDNRFKVSQIPLIADKRNHSGYDDSIIMYRVGDHIDISGGPMIARTGQVGRTKITSAHQIELDGLSLLRFQGVSLPEQLKLNPWAFNVLADRAKKLNKCGLDFGVHSHTEEALM